MEKGWVKFHRRILENTFLMHDDNAYIVFTKLLLMVGREKGQWAGGRNQLGELMRMNPRTLYGVLIRLQDNGIITIDSKGRYTVFTIANWPTYQGTAQTKAIRGDKTIATHRATLAKQGSFEELQQTTQLERNRSSTMAQHSYKNKNKNKEKDDALAEKEKAARNRKPGPGYAKAQSIAEQIKNRKKSL